MKTFANRFLQENITDASFITLVFKKSLLKKQKFIFYWIFGQQIHF